MAFDPFGTIWHLLVPFGVFWNLGTFWYLLLVPSCYILDLSRSDTVPTSNFPQWKKECRLVIGLECKALCNKWVWLSLALLLWSEKYFLTTKMYSNDIPTTTRTSSRWQSGRGWRPQNFCIPTVALALVKTSVSCRVSTNEMRPFGDWTQQGKKSNWKWLTIDTGEKASKKTQSLKVITILEVYIILGNVHNF